MTLQLQWRDERNVVSPRQAAANTGTLAAVASGALRHGGRMINKSRSCAAAGLSYGKGGKDGDGTADDHRLAMPLHGHSKAGGRRGPSHRLG